MNNKKECSIEEAYVRVKESSVFRSFFTTSFTPTNLVTFFLRKVCLCTNILRGGFYSSYISKFLFYFKIMVVGVVFYLKRTYPFQVHCILYTRFLVCFEVTHIFISQSIFYIKEGIKSRQSLE